MLKPAIPAEEGPWGMLTQEDVHALRARGWSVSAISRHTGRDRKTIRRYLAGDGAGQRRERAPSCLEPFRAYIEARVADDPHMDATVLHRELRRPELRSVTAAHDHPNWGMRWRLAAWNAGWECNVQRAAQEAP